MFRFIRSIVLVVVVLIANPPKSSTPTGSVVSASAFSERLYEAQREKYAKLQEDQQKDEAAKGEDGNDAGNHVAEEDL